MKKLYHFLYCVSTNLKIFLDRLEYVLETLINITAGILSLISAVIFCLPVILLIELLRIICNVIEKGWEE